jgi:hypothetical protein
MGSAASPPAPSWNAAAAYAWAYGKAIWQAMVLGLLLGSAVRHYCHRNGFCDGWVGRVRAASSEGRGLLCPA